MPKFENKEKYISSLGGQGEEVCVDGVGGHGRVQRLLHRVPQHDGQPEVGRQPTYRPQYIDAFRTIG